MRKIIMAMAVMTAISFSAELPICEEFVGEENVQCVSGEKQAVIITTHKDGTKTYEFFSEGKKAYIEVGENKIYASSGMRHLAVASIPTEDVERYVSEVFDAVVEDIGF